MARPLWCGRHYARRCVERLEQLLTDSDILSRHVRAIAGPNRMEGVACREVIPEAVPISLTHDLSPSALLPLTSELYGVCPRAYLLTICGESYAPGKILSPEVRRHLPELIEMAWRLVEDSLCGAASAR